MKKWHGAWRDEMESEAEQASFGTGINDPLLVSSIGRLGL
jgi:hypothetical protein